MGRRDYGHGHSRRDGAFDGMWGREGAAGYLCDIQRSMLRWKDLEEMVPIRVSGSKILVPDGAAGHMTQGTLSADKMRIIFDDGDQWVRQHAADADSSIGDKLLWEQQRVLEDWTAPEDEYLSLTQGELLFVKLELEQGWAFGKSVDSGKSGYFPPTFAEH